MKSIIKLRLVAALFVVAATAAQSFAAMDYYLKIEGIKGESKGKSTIVRCPDGSCSVDGLAPGEYTVSLVDANGKAWLPSNFKFECALVCRKAGGEQKDAMAAADQKSVQSPRDVATGMATGRRMHQPITITKETDKTSPALFSIIAPENNAGSGGGDAGVAIRWTLTVRVQRIEMK
ncbi:MAG TPA: type VI secretion system tube protein Hcp [Candidatus Kapabacteria bacterium]|nr:type VI secretion system tube protein Hcp [Candidatus Kapabacteria bacterium]